MYQSLIWPVDLGDEASGLRPALHAEDIQSAANALVDRVRRYAELHRNLFRGKMLIDEPQSVELALAQLGNAG